MFTATKGVKSLVTLCSSSIKKGNNCKILPVSTLLTHVGVHCILSRSDIYRVSVIRVDSCTQMTWCRRLLLSHFFIVYHYTHMAFINESVQFLFIFIMKSLNVRYWTLATACCLRLWEPTTVFQCAKMYSLMQHCITFEVSVGHFARGETKKLRAEKRQQGTNLSVMPHISISRWL